MAPLELPEGSVGVGKPAAQNYGLGDQWLSFNLTAICGANTPCTKVTSAEVYQVCYITNLNLALFILFFS
jgi:hypothetical protein